MPINYDKTFWRNGVTPVNSKNMNHIEDGIKEVTDFANILEEQIVEGLASKSNATNIENGTGNHSLQEFLDTNPVDFTNRNPNATSIDSSLTGNIATGGTGEESASFNGNTMALSKRSFANGNKTIAKGEESHAEGYQSVTLGDGSHAEGEQTTSFGSVSHSEGSNTVTLGTASHAEGVRSLAAFDASHAEGESTIANGYGSHAEGLGSYTGPISSAPDYPVTPEPGPSPEPSPTPTIQAGNVAHAEGNYCFAVGTGSHAEGYHTKALHEASHAEGVGTITYREGQLVIGWYNATPASNDLFVIGNGTSDEARNNAFVVSLDGSVTANTFIGNLQGTATNATTAGTANTAYTASIAQTANLVHVNPDSGYVGALLVNSDSNENTVVRKDNITVTADGRLTVAHDPTNNMDVATKQYVDTNSSSATNLENGEGNYSLQQKADTSTEHVKGGLALGNNSVALGVGDIYTVTIELGAGNFCRLESGTSLNPNWQNMILECNGDYYRITAVETLMSGLNVSPDIPDIIENTQAHIITQVAMGNSSLVLGEYSQAFGEGSVAGGIASKAIGNASIAEGNFTLANQSYASAFGDHTIASAVAQTALGKCNEIDYSALLVVGNGTDGSHRSTAFKVNADGTATVQSNPVNTKDVVTKEYADTKRALTTSRKVVYATSDTETSSGSGIYTQTELSYSTGSNANAIVQRDSVGQILVPTTPTDNAHATSKKYVDDADALKRDLVTSRKVLYATSGTETESGSGIYTQITISYSAGLNDNCMVQRDGKQIQVPDTPTQNNHATSKSYVDSNKGTKLYKHTIVGSGIDEDEQEWEFTLTFITPIQDIKGITTYIDLQTSKNMVGLACLSGSISNYYLVFITISNQHNQLEANGFNWDDGTVNNSILLDNLSYIDTVTDL